MSDEIMKRVEPAGVMFNRLPSPGRRQIFWRRQFQTEATLAQLIFDVTVGIVLPILCLVFDPIVFRGGFIGAPMLGSFQLFAYVMIGIEIAALGVWLAAGRRAGEWCGILGGVMLAGAVGSAVIGLLLFPLTVIGMVLGIGFLGLTPFATSFIYWRNARRAQVAAGASMSHAAACLMLLLGALIPFGVPAFAQWRINRVVEHSLSEVAGGDEARADKAARRLGYFSPFATVKLDEMVWAYSRETDPARKERLARAYRKITGGDIETRLYFLKD